MNGPTVRSSSLGRFGFHQGTSLGSNTQGSNGLSSSSKAGAVPRHSFGATSAGMVGRKNVSNVSGGGGNQTNITRGGAGSGIGMFNISRAPFRIGILIGILIEFNIILKITLVTPQKK